MYKDPFPYADSYKLNPFRHTKETRNAILIVSLGCLGFWILQGFDSGIAEYGTSLHWSFFVIYGLSWVGLSHYLEHRLGINGTRNFVYCFSVTALSIGVFEWFWSISYMVFHNQGWVVFNNWSHIIPFTGLIAIGIVYMLHIQLETKWSLNTKLWTPFLLGLTMGVLFIWYGIGFIQTVYPQIDGSLLYFENNLVHLINVLCKTCFACLVMTLNMLVVKKG